MHWLVTAGGTVVPIDRVRGITNPSTGRTGARIALEAHRRGERVTLLTSHPDAVAEVAGGVVPHDGNWQMRTYRTLDELHDTMRDLVSAGDLDCIVHSAAVSDYTVAGIFAPSKGTKFDPDTLAWSADGVPRLVDRAGGKVKSDVPELWLRMVNAPKLIDSIRAKWGFRGTLVKFKLEVGMADDELLALAERSRRHSDADLMVANTLEGAGDFALVGPIEGRYERVERSGLPARLVDVMQARST